MAAFLAGPAEPAPSTRMRNVWEPWSMAWETCGLMDPPESETRSGMMLAPNELSMPFVPSCLTFAGFAPAWGLQWLADFGVLTSWSRL